MNTRSGRGGGNSRQDLARRGETLAALLLRCKGYRIAARNWRCSFGEIDIIAWEREMLVFVEVKARRDRALGAPEEAVTTAKQQRLVRLAQAYLATRSGPPPPCRFDVIAVEGRTLPRVRHLRNAFRADGLG
jgi:putative endonuclease